jgi:predicted ATP-grasp superfamily ATP-dependent carboligase
MKNMLVFYGCHPDWSNIYNKNMLMNYLHDIIDDITIIKDIELLRQYLKSEGQNYKNYIMPSRIHHIHELNDANINSLFQIDSGYLKQLEDKKLFVDYVSKNNLKKFCPRIYTKSCNRNEDKLVIVKPRDSAFSIGVYKKKLRELDDCEFDNNVVQEYIYESKEYAGYFVSHNGNITNAFAYVGEYGNNAYIKCAGGKFDPTPQKRVVLNDKIKLVFEKFLKPCSYTGTCCFDFKIKDRKLYVFEINPRMGGSLNAPKNEKDLTSIIRDLMKIYDIRNVYN